MPLRPQSLVRIFLVICAVYTLTVFLGLFTTSSERLPAQSTRTTTASKHDTPAMSQDNAMHMSMQMSFEASTAVTLWLRQWHTQGWGSYMLSCGGLVALCLIHEILHAYRSSFHQQYVSNSQDLQYDRLQAPAEVVDGGVSSKRYACIPECCVCCSCQQFNNLIVLCEGIRQCFAAWQVNDSSCCTSGAQPIVCSQSCLLLPPYAGSHDLQHWLLCGGSPWACSGKFLVR